jgi:hypothetical protein
MFKYTKPRMYQHIRSFVRSISVQKFAWSNFLYKLPEFKLVKSLISGNTNVSLPKFLEPSLKLFWKEVMNSLDDKTSVKFIMRIRFKSIEGNKSIYLTKSISKLQIINKNDYINLLNILVGYLKIQLDTYGNNEIASIIFSYRISEDKNIKSLFTPATIDKVTHSTFGSYSLPTSADHKLWGNVLQESKTKITVAGKDLTYKILINGKKRIVEVISNGTSLLKFTDTFKKDSDSYIRTFDNQIYHISVKNGKIIFKMTQVKNNYMSKSAVDKGIKSNFITFDIETYEDNGKLIPYIISFFDGTKAWSYNLNNFKSSDDMLLEGIKSLMIRSYNGFSVYAHNLSKFDGIFLIRILAQLGKVNPTINGGQFVKTTLAWCPNDKITTPYKLHFKDSLLMLNGSLRDLTKSFGVESKLIFPVLFPNINNLGYKGTVPSINYFNNITTDLYQRYQDSFRGEWNLMIEAIKYCEQDCKSLYLVLDKFNSLIFNKFKINIHNKPTLPSLAMAIFKTNFLKNKTVPVLSGTMFKDISLSYTGDTICS